MKETVCMIRGVEDEWQHDAMGEPYAVPYFIAFCGATGYTGGEAWDYWVEPMDREKATCQECIDAYALHVLSEVP